MKSRSRKALALAVVLSVMLAGIGALASTSCREDNRGTLPPYRVVLP